MDIFEGLSRDQIGLLRNSGGFMEFDAGARIFKQGDAAFGIYAIAGGKVEIHRDTPNGKIVLSTQGSGEFFGEIGLLTDTESRTASATALERTTLFAIPGNPVKFFDRINDPGAALALLRNLVCIFGERVRNADEKRRSRPGPIGAEMEAEHRRSLERVKAELPQASRSQFFTDRSVSAEKYLFRENEPSESFFFIHDGAVAITKKDGGGVERVLNRLVAPTVIGELGFFTRQKRSAGARTETRVNYTEFSGKEFTQLEVRDPKAAVGVALAAAKLAVMQFLRKENAFVESQS